MEIEKDWRRQPKDGASQSLNAKTQPMKEYRVLGRRGLVTSSWYPLCAAPALRKGEAASFTILGQRVVLFRGESGRAYAMDAFCPHFGADLGNGRVKGERIQCYFHQWEFAGETGGLEKTPATETPPRCSKLKTYAVREAFGWLWVYSQPEDDVPQPEWPSFASGEDGFSLLETRLFVHHHALLMSAIDLHHFFSVHDLPIDFDYRRAEVSEQESHWFVSGRIPSTTWRTRLFRFLLGSEFSYEAGFFGGTLVRIRYGVRQPLFGRKSWGCWPELRVLWACTPEKEGVSRARIFVLMAEGSKWTRPFRRWGTLFLAGFVLWLLKDDDVKAYPHMRFHPQVFVDKDKSSFDFIRSVEKLEVSPWSSES